MGTRSKQKPAYNAGYRSVREINTLCNGAFHMLAQLYPSPDRGDAAQNALEQLHKACSALESLMLKENA